MPPMADSLKNLGISFPFLVAPMVGISHVAFRELVRSYLPQGVEPLLFTEMLSSRRLPSERLDNAESLYIATGETRFIPQLLGNEEQFIAPSIRKLMPLSPWGFDINMGCPKSHALQHNWGVRLLGDKNYAGEVVRMTKRHSPVPVSVKLRAGLDDTIDMDYLYRFTETLEEAGADWLTIHCRTKSQGHRGVADWGVVGKIAARRSIPVVLNGDIQTAEDACQAFTENGVSGVMVARAATARPWILWQIAHRLRFGDLASVPPITPEEEGAEYFRACFKFSHLLEKYFGETKPALKRMEFFVALGSRWLPFGHELWRLVKRSQSLAEARSVVSDYGEKYPQRMSLRVNL
jgi:tRNA-dihydrouridine synthase B